MGHSVAMDIAPLADGMAVIPRLHAQQGLQGHPESLLDPKRHLGRKGGLAVRKVGERGPPDAKDLGGAFRLLIGGEAEEDAAA